MHALLTGDLLSGLVSVLCYIYVCAMYTLLTGDLLSGLVSVLCNCCVVWKIFVWNYFVVRNIREKNFRGLVPSTHENILTMD